MGPSPELVGDMPGCMDIEMMKRLEKLLGDMNCVRGPLDSPRDHRIADAPSGRNMSVVGFVMHGRLSSNAASVLVLSPEQGVDACSRSVGGLIRANDWQCCIALVGILLGEHCSSNME